MSGRSASQAIAFFPERHDEKCGEQGAHGLTRVPTNLKQRLREPVLTAGRQTRNARGFGVEHRGADADERRRDQNRIIVPGKGEQKQTAERDRHADRQRIRLRIFVRIKPDQRLQQRAGELEGERNQANLAEAEPERGLKDGVDGWQQRLNGIVQEMRTAEHYQECKKSRLGICRAVRRRGLDL